MTSLPDFTPYGYQVIEQLNHNILFVPSTQKLIFYDQGYNSQIELHNSTKEKEIIQTFSKFAMIISHWEN